MSMRLGTAASLSTGTCALPECRAMHILWRALTMAAGDCHLTVQHKVQHMPRGGVPRYRQRRLVVTQ